MNLDRQPCRTLIVEDEPSSRKALQRLLLSMGHEVEVARSLGEGIAKLAWRPSCIVLDLMLPDGNGIELLKRIRDEELSIRVAITTATYDPPLMARVAKFEPDAVFNKPVNLEGLYAWLGSPFSEQGVGHRLAWRFE